MKSDFALVHFSPASPRRQGGRGTRETREGEGMRADPPPWGWMPDWIQSVKFAWTDILIQGIEQEVMGAAWNV